MDFWLVIVLCDSLAFFQIPCLGLPRPSESKNPQMIYVAFKATFYLIRILLGTVIFVLKSFKNSAIAMKSV